MEVFSHFAANQGQRALDLIRLQWGYMLNAKISTQSTFWEGYNVDGTLNFRGTYMSNAHGWAAGPGGALTDVGGGIFSQDPVGPFSDFSRDGRGGHK